MNISAKRFSGKWSFVSGLVLGIVVTASILAVPLGKNLDESKLRAIQTDYPADTFFLLAVSFNEGPRFIVIDGPLRVGEEVAARGGRLGRHGLLLLKTTILTVLRLRVPGLPKIWDSTIMRT